MLLSPRRITIVPMITVRIACSSCQLLMGSVVTRRRRAFVASLPPSRALVCQWGEELILSIACTLGRDLSEESRGTLIRRSVFKAAWQFEETRTSSPSKDRSLVSYFLSVSMRHNRERRETRGKAAGNLSSTHVTAQCSY